MNTAIPSKRTLIAGMALSNAVLLKETTFSHHEASTYSYLGVTHPCAWPIYKTTTTDTMQLYHRGFVARIYANGRVTLDSAWGYCGELLDVKAKGKTLAQRRANGIKLLHDAIKRSGLRN